MLPCRRVLGPFVSPPASGLTQVLMSARIHFGRQFVPCAEASCPGVTTAATSNANNAPRCNEASAPGDRDCDVDQRRCPAALSTTRHRGVQVKRLLAIGTSLAAVIGAATAPPPRQDPRRCAVP